MHTLPCHLRTSCTRRVGNLGRRFDLIDQIAAERRFRMLVFTGGEPLVRGDLFDLLAHSRDRGLVNVVATNATLIDTSVAKELRRLNVRGVAVSLDHTDQEEHNRIRQDPRAFERAMCDMNACAEADIALQVNFTAMPDNRNNIREMLLLCDEIGASIVLCYQVVPMGREKRITSLSVDENRALLEEIACLQSHISPIVEPIAAPQYWAYLLSRNSQNGRIRQSLARRLFHGCTAGWGQVYIKPDGQVWPCPFVPLSGGSVRERPFGEIWRGAKLFEDLRHRDRLKGSCGTCEYRSVCGGCRGKAFAHSGDSLGEDPTCFLRDDISGVRSN